MDINFEDAKFSASEVWFSKEGALGNLARAYLAVVSERDALAHWHQRAKTLQEESFGR
jgi:hypothetical protein